MRLGLLVAAAMTLATSGAAHADPITYNVNIAYSNVSAIGTITTDGTIGSLTNRDITGFNIVVTQGGSSTDIASGNSGSLTDTQVLTATASGLFFNFSAPGHFYVQANGSQGYGYLCFEGPNDGGCSVASSVDNIVIQEIDYLPRVAESMSGVYQFASSNVAATPEPSSFALLGTGLLGAAGLMKRRFA